MRKATPRKIVALFTFALLAATSLAAQQAARSTVVRPDRAAAQRANELVSLSADKILEIFRDEPGLLLEFKRTLVTKAYEQGRLLDPDSLNDDAIFELIRTQAQIRALATLEIEKRSYIRAKPTDEELREAGRRAGADGAKTEISHAPMTEKEYWKQRVEMESEREKQRTKTLEQQQQQAPRVPAPDMQPGPSSSPGDRRREMLRAGAQEQNSDQDFDSNMPRIRPEDLPALLAQGDMTGSSAGIVSAAERARLGGSASSQLGMEGANLAALQPSAGSLPSDYPREASLDTRSRVGQQRPRTQPAYEPPVMRRRANPYADVPSLYDLYSQVAPRGAALPRFGMDVFSNESGVIDQVPMDLPVGPDYVLGPGDTLKIDLWGSVSQRLQRVVDREGRVSLPEAGALQVTGKSLAEVQEEIQKTLRTQYREVRADVSLARLRTIRVWVVGDVMHPGAYDISALSTPLNAVFAAGGPSSRGSLRNIKQLRGKQLVQEVDLYDLILHGVRPDINLLQSGDILQVPPIGPQVTVEGMVRRPAVYELHGESNLADILDTAGGVLASGTLRHIDVERVQAHDRKVMLSLDLPETNDAQAVTKAMEGFKVQDGDVIRISPILPYSYKTVYLDGHVFHPGKYPYTEGMKLTDLIKSYADLLPEPSRRHAEIIRLNAPDYRPVVLGFNLADALSGKGTVPELKPFDTVRIFGRYDFEDAPEVSVSGEVRDPGDHLTNGETHIRDAVYLAGGVTRNAKLDDAQVYRKLPTGEVKILSVNLGAALSGDPKENILLESKDRVIIHRDLARLDPAAVVIEGEVANPGKYPLAENMSAADLVRLAGGFKRGAYTESADLSRYVVENGKRILGEHLNVPIAKAMSGEPDSDMRLMDGDVLSIRQLAGWAEVGASVTVSGEVLHPGSYGIYEGEKLSAVLQRAGGLTASAYPYGAVLERAQVREFSEKSRQEMIRRLEAGGNVNVSGNVTGQEQAALVQAAMQQQQQVLAALRNQPASGRLVIHISADIRRWANTPADLEMRPGDTIVIPKRPNFIVVTGQVYNSSALSYAPGKNAGWYLQQAGGPTSLADKKAVYVIRADGSVVGREGGIGGGFWRGNALSTRLQPGDTVVVPEKFIGGSSAWKELLSVGQFASSVAIAARVATSF